MNECTLGSWGKGSRQTLPFFSSLGCFILSHCYVPLGGHARPWNLGDQGSGIREVWCSEDAGPVNFQWSFSLLIFTRQGRLPPSYTGSCCLTRCLPEAHFIKRLGKLVLLGKGQLSISHSQPYQWAIRTLLVHWIPCFTHTVSSVVGIFSTQKENMSDALGISAWRQMNGDCLQKVNEILWKKCVALGKPLTSLGFRFLIYIMKELDKVIANIILALKFYDPQTIESINHLWANMGGKESCFRAISLVACRMDLGI